MGLSRSPSSSYRNNPRCAILLYGLPRAFASLVLPSLEKHVIPYNPHCDYFLHAVRVEQEPPSRAGRGGSIYVDDLHLFQSAVHGVFPNATVQIQIEDPHVFQQQRNATLQHLYEWKTPIDSPGKGRPMALPYMSKAFTMDEQVVNIVKMWHSIEGVWNFMASKTRSSAYYNRVALLRSDVVYLTPLNIWEIAPGQIDEANNATILPGFAQNPSNDRLVSGPWQAVKLFATTRFSRIDQFLPWSYDHQPGWGLHNERFVHHALVPAIQSLGLAVTTRWDICFVRARADHRVWFTDCTIAADEPYFTGNTTAYHGQAVADVLSNVVNRTCLTSSILREPVFGTWSIQCP